MKKKGRDGGILEYKILSCGDKGVKASGKASSAWFFPCSEMGGGKRRGWGCVTLRQTKRLSNAPNGERRLREGMWFRKIFHQNKSFAGESIRPCTQFTAG